MVKLCQEGIGVIKDVLLLLKGQGSRVLFLMGR